MSLTNFIRIIKTIDLLQHDIYFMRLVVLKEYTDFEMKKFDEQIE